MLASEVTQFIDLVKHRGDRNGEMIPALRGGHVALLSKVALLERDAVLAEIFPHQNLICYILDDGIAGHRHILPCVILYRGPRLFLACDATLQENIVRRKNISSALLGGEGLFNLCLSGQGYAVLESPVPREELFEFVLNNEELRIDGNMAIAWSSTLQFTVETLTGSAMGSAVSKEGFVNVYRGSGKVLMAPTAAGVFYDNNGPEKTTTSSHGMGATIASSIFNA